MSKILLFSRDPLPSAGQIATGGGLRALSIVRGLEKCGHKVVIAFPEEVIRLFQGIMDGENFYSYSTKNIDTLIKNLSPDVVIQEAIGDVQHLKRISVPIIFDLQGSRLLEAQYLDISLETDIVNKIESLSLGDYFICSNRRQKHYFLSWLMLAGVDLKKEIIGIVPYSVSPQIKEKVFKDHTPSPIFVWGGIFWPWQNCSQTINSILKKINNYKCGELKIIGGNFPFKYNKIKKFSNITEKLNKSNRLECLGLLPYDQMKDLYSKCTIAIDLADNSNERELASPFRTIDYLSCGLPVIINDSLELSKAIVKYEAGWSVNPDNHNSLKNLIEEILESPDKVSLFSKNAQKLVRNHFIWGKGLEDLDRFCKNPEKRKKNNSFFNNIVRFNLGKTMREKGYHKEAAEEFHKLLKEGKEKEWVHFQLGLTYQKSSDYEKALMELEAEEKKFPKKAATKTEVGYTYLLMKNYDKALCNLENSLKIDPSWEWTHYYIGFILMKKGKILEAVNHFEQTGPLFSLRPYALYYSGSIYNRLKDNKKSELCFKKLLEVNFDTCDLTTEFKEELLAGSYFHLGNIYKTYGKIEEAFKYFEKCLLINPNHCNAKKYLKQLNE